MSQKIAYSYESAADVLDISKDVLRRAVKAGDLCPRFVGSAPRFSHQELVEWFDSLPSEKPAK